MATAEQIAALRLLISEPTTVPYTDVILAARIDATTANMDLAAREVWVEKAAAYAVLANISEGGSSRSMGDLQSKALKMVELFDSRYKAGLELAGGGSGVVITKLSR